ncbi:unnamed protein product [Rhizophagus irregularis]|uniref:Uncharacterized protein n=4 Tax=Rhizophagus irregularis TaxID=588596 RepID=A0A2I1GGB2_9GLOM|nr:hypothetical protein GLOIN_2v1578567 [Rhizophagus irregularis DAOM 181602=DAOM 197198]EXX72548.1 hypothetical protein RirG_068420 [Rhizophagus irregularis DAOM 197198w]PKK74982.1 hypothetical protein RhiirC2_737573 [Rhizophagus irregularis]PKY45664.1 hypothetical protein RhiirA4_401537 [Rhizophagus irregularis]POG74217.1 hypothetical protein GLOIN_2v1578567 [Rhizophagus irregularis DAOM 181602=DAOM 197198]UZO17469.1 hypothetical protein OCT59_008824 [Rhizophagus irregularis]|eukprot:XP_025181083.1 hypothetical protein GLOIN_2v1578567 [Rhizophagus irregularis DAOM 181602=DAOM 197198]
MVDTTINYNPNTQETKLFNDKNYDKNYEILSVRKAAEIFSTVSKGNIDKDLKKSCNDDKEKSGFVGYLKDVGWNLLGPNKVEPSYKTSISPPRDIKIVQSIKDPIVKKPPRKKSLTRAKAIEREEHLISPINIYIEHRDHLEQYKRARVNLDILKEEIYVPKNQNHQVMKPLPNPCGLLDIKFFLNIGYGGDVIGLGNNMWGIV